MADINDTLRSWVDTEWSNLSLNDFAIKADFLAPGVDAPAWQALAGDAGFRQYFRLASEPPLLAVSAPPATEKNEAFVAVGQLMRQGGVLTPAVAACDLSRGFFLIEDFGPTLLLDVLDADNADGFYHDALSTLVQIQLCKTDTAVLPLYDKSLLQQEMALFPEWFVRRLLNIEMTDRDHQVLDQCVQVLTDSALEQPQVVVHRDFHSRNLVVRKMGPLGVIDFQDAVIGPVTYDLVSLLRDCYIQWPQARIDAWLTFYRAHAEASGLVLPEDEETFKCWFDWMGLQRHLKVLGIFARLSLRDQKHRYLSDLPLVVHYTLTVARQYEALDGFVEWFEAVLMPEIKKQGWWRPIGT